MAHDPLTHVASWLTPARPDVAGKLSITVAEAIDPAIALRDELAAIEEATSVADEAGDQARLAQLADRTHEIEIQIAELVPSNLEGILLQARTLKGLSDFDLERDPHAARCHGDLITNMIAGLERLSVSSTGDLAVVAASPDDSRILSLFREWMAAHRAAQAIWDQVDYGEEETRTANVRCFDIIHAIADIPAAGPAGLAIKAYLRHHNEYAEFIVDPPCAIPSFEEGDERYYDAHLDKSIIEDAVCFAPELAPLINGVRRGTPSAAVEGSSMTEEERCIAERGLALLPAYRALSHGADWAVCPPEPPAPGKRELTDAEREFADTFIELGYRPSTVAGDPKPKVIGFGEPSEPS